MMEFFQQLPHLEPYGNPQYFVYVIAATLPIFIGLFFKKRFAWYEVLVSLFFIVTMLVGGKTSTSCLGYLPLLGNIAPAFLQALSKKQGWQVGLLLS
ncbi:activated D-alanine transport protein [Streptococcus pneumoniae]|nr:activated D-alanine transport protein [Streptococcus pneumoniae]